MPDWLNWSWDLGKLLLAAGVGGAIGFERESHGQVAGLRTNILICVGACLMMMLSLHMESLFQHLNVDQSVVRLDPARIASYAIASMGFLGAGAIITGKGSVAGLTTAAGLWLLTGIGLAIGAGYLLPALFATIISLVGLYGLRLLKRFYERDEFTIMVLKYQGTDGILDEVKAILARYRAEINFINFKHELPTQTFTYRVRLQSKNSIPWNSLVHDISHLKGLQEVSWEESQVP